MLKTRTPVNPHNNGASRGPCLTLVPADSTSMLSRWMYNVSDVPVTEKLHWATIHQRDNGVGSK